LGIREGSGRQEERHRELGASASGTGIPLVWITAASKGIGTAIRDFNKPWRGEQI